MICVCNDIYIKKNLEVNVSKAMNTVVIFTVGLLVIFLYTFSCILRLTRYVYYFIKHIIFKPIVACNRNECKRHYAKLKKPDTKDSMLHDSIHMTF